MPMRKTLSLSTLNDLYSKPHPNGWDASTLKDHRRSVECPTLKSGLCGIMNEVFPLGFHMDGRRGIR
eukprot:scaffold1388_cov267-Chaetoceros_neogracile.AAC.1